MSFDNNRFFGTEKLFNNKDDKYFFLDTDVNTIGGKNQVLNYVARMELELRVAGFTEAVVEIAQFYDNFVAEGNKVADFYLNPVIKMILVEIEDKPRLKTFLYERIFDDVKNEYIKECENTFNENENLQTDVNMQEQNYKKDKVLKEKEIKRLAKEQNISYEEAKELIQNKEQDQVEQKELVNFMNGLGFSLPSFGLNPIDISQNIPKNLNKKSKKQNNKDKTKYVSLDDDTKDNNQNNDIQDDWGKFWG